jgi:hypothetical protein
MDDDDVALYLGGDGENELAAEDIVVVILLFYFISGQTTRSLGVDFLRTVSTQMAIIGGELLLRLGV